jgi:hypothetical protein
MTAKDVDQQNTGARPATGAARRQDDRTPAEQAIAADIEQTRAALGETVEQLAAKAQVGTHARHAAEGLRDRARQQAAALGQQAASQFSHLTEGLPDTLSEKARAISAGTRRYWREVAGAALTLGLVVAAVRKMRR